MALEGNLSSFGLSEILQLISVQQKTGMLTVGNDNVNAVMFFQDGQLVSTRDRRRRARDPFKEYLTRYGVLSGDELIRISQISSQSKLDFTDIVASEGFLSPEELARQWQKQIQEAMHDVLTWDQCAYKFISNPEVVAGIKSLGQFSVEAMLMESMRRIDEFPQMLEMFPHDTLLVERSNDEYDTEGMTQNEKDILELLPAPLNLRDIIARGKMPLFEVYEALKLLKDKSLVTVAETEPVTSDEVTATRSKVKRKRMGNMIPPVVAAAALVAAMTFGFKDAPKLLQGHFMTNLTTVQDDNLARARVEHNVRAHLEYFFAENGRYPSSLTELTEAKLASESLLARADAYDIRYQLTDGHSTYTLR